MHIWDIGTVSHCTWTGLQCDIFWGKIRKLFFCVLDGSFAQLIKI